MKSLDLDSIKTAWKNERSFEDRKLSEADIQRFLSKRTKDISHLFKMGLVVDIFLKILIGISFLGIIILFKENLNMVLLATAILLGLIWAIRYQWQMIGKIPKSSVPEPVVRTSLEEKILFYHQKYIYSLYVGALSNALLILAGLLYYFYFKYGEIRPFQWDDYLVFSLTMLIGFGLGAAAQIAQHRFQIKQLESCLQEIDEDMISTFTLREQRNKRRRMILAFLLALICGLLILSYFIFR
jgi:hypothetical protein